MTFEDVVKECLNTPELVNEYNRLTDSRLGIDNRKPIEKMIDKATGYEKELDNKQREYLHDFISFVFEFVWLPFVFSEVVER